MVVDGRKNKNEQEEKRANLEVEGTRIRQELEAMEAKKWIEHFDEYTERVYFEHTETGEIAWDKKPVRGFVMRK